MQYTGAMHCPSCSSENAEGAKFCSECGTPFVRLCPSCGQQMQPTAKFCSECGTPLVAKGKRPAAKRRKEQSPTRARKMPRRAPSPPVAPPRPTPPEAERRQLTVAFIDLVGSTQLSAQLDPEDYRAVVQDYQQTCVAVLQRHGGYLAQSLGDGLLVYFGYPTAHEDDARRAVRTGLEIVAALRGQVRPHALPVRIGIHTGLVVIGEIGVRGRTEQLALGETPNIAARLQGLAEPNTVLISAATYRLIDGQFDCHRVGAPPLKGLDTPMAVYHVQSERPSVSPLAGRTALTPLVGREQEVGLLLDRWEQAKEGRGQVVLLSGEPGIGKSRLAYTLREHVTTAGARLFEARCSPYHQHSAFYPLIDVLQRTLLVNRQDTESARVEKLERALTVYGLPESLPLFTALLSLPTPSQYPPLTLTPQKQKERTLQALVQLLLAQAERQATVSVWEDVHWADPSSLEFLSLLIEQIPTSKLLVVLTCRPEFTPPWKPRSHLSHLVLTRLGKKQVEVMIAKVGAGQALAPEVIEQIGSKTDGVPLFVEELTKSVLESLESPHHIPFRLSVPATLQEALLARLDRLAEARQVAQLGATLGREFSYELLHAVSPLSEPVLQAALSKLVDAEILYQRGVGEQTRYVFKHALIQDTAYQSLLKSTRQQYHQQIAQALQARFPSTKATQPELLAHHYTEAGLIEQAIPYWHQAGQKSLERSAHTEAIRHLSQGLELLKPLPATPERTQHELELQIALGPALMSAKGWAAPEVRAAYTRARHLCQQVGDTPQLFPVLRGLWEVYQVRGELQPALELANQLLTLAQRGHDAVLLVEAHNAQWQTWLPLGEFVPTREHIEQGLALYNLAQHRANAFLYGGYDPGVACWSCRAWTLWFLGYPDQALQSIREALALAQELAHAGSLAFALVFAAWLYQYRREQQLTQERAEALITLSGEQGFPLYWAWGTLLQGRALTEQGQREEGLARLQQGLAAYRTTGAELFRPYFLSLLAAAYGKGGQAEEGLTTLAEALTQVDNTQERWYEAELYRLKGMLTLQAPSSDQFPQVEKEAEASFLKAINIAQNQRAKSWELRAATSLARLWQSQGKQKEAHHLLSEVYYWFTEGFDTKDLQEAKALLEELR
jgi:class 3 adenylate cyclase/predicted ATPase